VVTCQRQRGVGDPEKEGGMSEQCCPPDAWTGRQAGGGCAVEDQLPCHVRVDFRGFGVVAERDEMVPIAHLGEQFSLWTTGVQDVRGVHVSRSRGRAGQGSAASVVAGPNSDRLTPARA